MSSRPEKRLAHWSSEVAGIKVKVCVFESESERDEPHDEDRRVTDARARRYCTFPWGNIKILKVVLMLPCALPSSLHHLATVMNWQGQGVCV